MPESDVLEKLNEIHSDVRLTRAELKEVRSDVASHHTILHGNGREGLKIRVDRIETSQSTAHKMWLTMVGVASTVIAWLGLTK